MNENLEILRNNEGKNCVIGVEVLFLKKMIISNCGDNSFKCEDFWKNVCRHCILYLLRLKPLFPSDVEILNPKVGLELDQI